ncbi:alpha/beta hydrolase [Pedobacter endophyticus]|uniref:Alpha/beta hydrolase n=1 Tax=Pedobacter endophyticus TaxID=2789740 RepID=A0A7S9KZ00_9SPHI|nr:alpha/beta hydrolase-fold protein [Pedobacter endophyticus]QPH39071.1 alpha/beta hydrolase [Pedobacter endophyticus]
MDTKMANRADYTEQETENYSFGDHVHVVDPTFYIPQLDKYRKIWIYLPKSYKHGEKKYPVIYMQDGQNLFHASPPRNDEWAVDAVMDGLIREGAKEAIIVGVDHAGEDRLREYNPYDSEHGKGEGRAYVQFLAETLKPFIDSEYRTFKDARNTSIAGSSMGGLIAMYAIITYPDVFGSAGVFSPSFWLAPKIYDDVEEKSALLKNNKVFFVVGDKEGSAMVRNMKRVYDILNPDGKNTNVAFLERADGKHTEWFWHREFVSFYQFIAPLFSVE